MELVSAPPRCQYLYRRFYDTVGRGHWLADGQDVKKHAFWRRDNGAGIQHGAGFLAPTPMTNRGKIFFESEPAALAAHGPLPQISEPVLPPPGIYPSGEELARRLEYFVNVEINAAELKDKRAKRPR